MNLVLRCLSMIVLTAIIVTLTHFAASEAYLYGYAFIEGHWTKCCDVDDDAEIYTLVLRVIFVIVLVCCALIVVIAFRAKTHKTLFRTIGIVLILAAFVPGALKLHQVLVTTPLTHESAARMPVPDSPEPPM